MLIQSVQQSIVDRIVVIEDTPTQQGWVFTIHGLIEWIFENASPDALMDFCNLWDSVDESDRINIIYDIAQARVQDD